MSYENSFCSPTCYRNKQKEWSRKFKKCVKCKATTSAHAANGLCTKCYDNIKGIEKKYGISLKMKKQMYKNQSEKCVLCREDFIDITRAQVDHDHETKEVRGLLCGRCNKSLGGFHDSPQILQAAISYLQK